MVASSYCIDKTVIISANKMIPFVNVELNRPESYDALKVFFDSRFFPMIGVVRTSINVGQHAAD